MRRALEPLRGVLLLSMMVLGDASSVAAADVWGRLLALGERAGISSVRSSAGGIEQAAAGLHTLPEAVRPTALAADASPEGHWTFINAGGDRFTAGTVEELKRVASTLAPEMTKAAARLTLILTEDSVFRQRDLIKTLQQGLNLQSQGRRLDLMVAVDGNVYLLKRRIEGKSERLLAEVRPNLLLELTDRRLFDEAAWQLAHPLRRASVRVLALEPGGPASLTSQPRLDPQSKRALTDTIDPEHVIAALPALRGQTAIITGRIEGDRLMFRPSSGAERSVSRTELQAAVEAYDINLVMLQSATPRQPGTRSWLWQRVSIERLDTALDRDHLADFLNAMGTPQTRLLVTASELAGGRIRLTATPVRDESSPRTGIGEALSDMVSDIAGRVVTSSVEASLKSSSRQRELDRRLIAVVPSVVQYGYLALMLLGFAGRGVAQPWWNSIWPPETRENYAGAFGHRAAEAIRWVAFALLFMPAVALASAPLAMLRRAAPQSA